MFARPWGYCLVDDDFFTLCAECIDALAITTVGAARNMPVIIDPAYPRGELFNQEHP